MTTRGVLFLVVGPSGVGKDAIISGVKNFFVFDHRVVFPRRAITRVLDKVGEDHIPMSEEIFEARLNANDFCLNWYAHNLRYGVLAIVERHLREGRCVVVNVSRTVIDEARLRLAPLKVISIIAPADELTRRLMARGREKRGAIKKRVARADAFNIEGPDVVIIDNGGSLNDSVDVFAAEIDKALNRAEGIVLQA